MAFPSNDDLGAAGGVDIDLGGAWGVRNAQPVGSSVLPGVVVGSGDVVGGDSHAEPEPSKAEDGSGKLETEYVRFKKRGRGTKGSSGSDHESDEDGDDEAEEPADDGSDRQSGRDEAAG